MFHVVKKFLFLTKYILIFILSIVCSHTVLAIEHPVRTQLDENDAIKIATEAYIYGYPLVLMDTKRRMMTNVPAATHERAPMNQFAHMRTLPNENSKSHPMPNPDVLYSEAWLDLRNEPYIIHFPDMKDRYYIMTFINAWSEVFATIGTRTSGNQPINIALVGPNWKGTLPEDVEEVKAPTNIIWIAGKTEVNGTKEDYKKIHVLQDQYTITPLSSWGGTYVTPNNMPIDSSIDMKMPARDQVNKMDAATFYRKLAVLLRNNPPTKIDGEMTKKLMNLGIISDKNFDLGKLDITRIKALRQSVSRGHKEIVNHTSDTVRNINGWQLANKIDDYLSRASAAYINLDRNFPKDYITFITSVDNNGKRLDSKNKYILHFDKDQLPPVEGFWSISLYDDQHFFTENKTNRNFISSKDKLDINPDGTLDLYIQKKSPSNKKEANWLPSTSKGNFHLAFRVYWPKEVILKEKWVIPGVKEHIEVES